MPRNESSESGPSQQRAGRAPRTPRKPRSPLVPHPPSGPTGPSEPLPPLGPLGALGPARDRLSNPDPVNIRALAHPLRLKILDLLHEHEQLTATQVSDLVGESPTNCAFHLRTLGRYGYIVEGERGKGRERPWKTKPGELFLDPVGADEETTTAITAAKVATEAHDRARREAWQQRRPAAPLAWQKVAFEMRFETWLTPAELERVSRTVNTAIHEIIAQRPEDRDPAAVPVVISASGFPYGADLSGAETDDPPPSPTSETPRTRDPQ